MSSWSLPFLTSPASSECKRALIILNQPFSTTLFHRLWESCEWHCCADGGANRLYDEFASESGSRELYKPDLIKGDLDSIRHDVREYYTTRNVPVVQDHDQDSTDLMKCFFALSENEQAEGQGQYDIILLGGLSGRLDHTFHTLSCLHKLRKTRKRVFAVTDENIGWVLDAGEHSIHVDHAVVGPTCGLLPVGIESTVLSTAGLRWNLGKHKLIQQSYDQELTSFEADSLSSFDGLVSTSNHLIPEEDTVWIKTSKPIWWTVELRDLNASY